MILKKWAEWQGINYRTAQQWYRDGILPVPAYRVRNTILIGPIHPPPPPARVASLYLQGELNQLNDAIADLTRWAVNAEFLVGSVILQIITNRSTSIPKDIVATLQDQNRSLLVAYLTTPEQPTALKTSSPVT